MTLRSAPFESVSRVEIRKVDDDGPVQTMQVAEEQVDDQNESPLVECETMFSYGFSAVPPVGAEALALAVGGDQDQLVIIAAIAHAQRPRDLKPGEVALHFGKDVKVFLAADGKLCIGAREPDDYAARASVTDDRLDALESKLNSLITKYNTHTQETALGPTTPPLVTETTLSPGESVASSVVKLQS